MLRNAYYAYRTNDKVQHLSRPCVTRQFCVLVTKGAKWIRSRSPFRKVLPFVSRPPVFFLIILTRSLDSSSQIGRSQVLQETALI